MSIIQEALKKAQDTYSNKTNQAPKKEVFNRTIPEEVASKKPVKHHSVMPFSTLGPAVLILTIIIGFALKSFFSSAPLSSDSRNISTKSHQEVSYQTDAPAKDAESAADNIISPIKNALSSRIMMSQPPDLILNGIMYLQEKPRAIINGSIVEEGDTVNGAVVKVINKDNVLLNFNEVEIALKLKE